MAVMTSAPIEDELRTFIADRARAVAERDSDVLIAMHAPDVTSFPVLPPSRTAGTGAVEESLEAWFGGYAEGPGYEVHGLEVGGDGDAGHCAFRYHVTGTLQDGSQVDMWVRSTLVCRRADGVWRVVHQHESVPFEPDTGAALVSLGPDDD